MWPRFLSQTLEPTGDDHVIATKLKLIFYLAVSVVVCESGQFFPESSVNASVYSVEPFVLLLTEWIRIRISNLDQVAEYGINLNPDPNSIQIHS